MRLAFLSAMCTVLPVLRAADDPEPARPRPLQVLYLEGSPRWEYRSHRLLLERGPEKSKPFRYRVLMQNADAEYLQQEKRALDEMPVRGELDHFDLVILGDIDPGDRRLGKEHEENLARFVREGGGGLLVIAGMQHMPHAWKKTALADVLPIELGVPPPKERLAADRKESYRPALTEAGLKHPAFRFDPDAATSRKVWAALPPLYWYAQGYTARKGAEVLATHPTARENDQPLPLILWHKVGKGRCAFIGFDESWRWKANEGNRHYQSFWTTLWRSLASP
jgi:uncharacterized membrane protein